jgi:Xaa-Pro aminopeptidase
MTQQQFDCFQPGAKVSEQYRVKTVREHGFDSPYRPGHFLGLDTLDFWTITADNHRELLPGMIIAVHPGVLAKFGKEGCSMGYTYLITETGAERWSEGDLAADLLG